MLNECRFIGNVTRQPEIGKTESGVKYARFSIACNERGYKKQDGTEVPERVEFIPCTAWRGNADVLEKYVSKGQLLMVAGKFHTAQYTSPDGEKRNYSDIQVTQLLLLGGKRDAAPVPAVEPEKQTTVVETTQPPTPIGDDLPF